MYKNILKKYIEFLYVSTIIYIQTLLELDFNHASGLFAIWKNILKNTFENL